MAFLDLRRLSVSIPIDLAVPNSLWLRSELADLGSSNADAQATINAPSIVLSSHGSTIGEW